MEDFTRNYKQLFREAKAANNIFQMNEIFESLCNEAGVPDPERDTAQSAAGSELAKLLNNRGKGPEAKRL